MKLQMKLLTASNEKDIAPTFTVCRSQDNLNSCPTQSNTAASKVTHWFCIRVNGPQRIWFNLQSWQMAISDSAGQLWGPCRCSPAQRENKSGVTNLVMTLSTWVFFSSGGSVGGERRPVPLWLHVRRCHSPPQGRYDSLREPWLWPAAQNQPFATSAGVD